MARSRPSTTRTATPSSPWVEDPRLWGLAWTVVHAERGIANPAARRSFALRQLADEGVLDWDSTVGAAPDPVLVEGALATVGAASLDDVADRALLPDARAEYEHQARLRRTDGGRVEAGPPPRGRGGIVVPAARHTAARARAPRSHHRRASSAVVRSGPDDEGPPDEDGPLLGAALTYQPSCSREEADAGYGRLVRFLARLRTSPPA